MFQLQVGIVTILRAGAFFWNKRILLYHSVIVVTQCISYGVKTETGVFCTEGQRTLVGVGIDIIEVSL